MAELSLDSAIGQVVNLKPAIESALANEVADAIKKEIADVADRNVYTYGASPFFMGTRRKGNGGIKDEKNMVSRVVNGDTLIVENVTPLQNLWGGGHTERLTPVVESGDKRYHQPHPRPFMDEAKTQLIDKGRALSALKAGLQRQGIDVTGMEFRFE